MIPPFVIRAVTVAVFFVGFALGWWWRGWCDRDRELAEQLFEGSPRKTDRSR